MHDDDRYIGHVKGEHERLSRIAQKWRGAVGTSGGTGFAKDYSYDSRLQFASPPYFPQWTNAAWGSKVTGELSPKY